MEEPVKSIISFSASKVSIVVAPGDRHKTFLGGVFEGVLSKDVNWETSFYYASFLCLFAPFESNRVFGLE